MHCFCPARLDASWGRPPPPGPHASSFTEGQERGSAAGMARTAMSAVQQALLTSLVLCKRLLPCRADKGSRPGLLRRCCSLSLGLRATRLSVWR